MSSDWASGLVRERKEKQEKQRIADEKTLSDRTMVERNSEPRWNKICKLLNEFAGDLNKGAGEDSVIVDSSTPHEIQVKIRGNARSASSIKFDVREQSLKVGFHGCELRLSVGNGDQLIWKSAGTSDAWDEEQIAKKTIESAWRNYK